MPFSFISKLIPIRNHQVLNTKERERERERGVGGEIVIPNYKLITTIGDGHSHFASLLRKKTGFFFCPKGKIILMSSNCSQR